MQTSMKSWYFFALIVALAAPAVCQSTTAQNPPRALSAASPAPITAQVAAPPAPPAQQMQNTAQRPAISGAVGGGSAADYNADTTTTIVKTVNEVNLVFTVTDRHGHFISDLKRDDIKVLDDNKPTAISSFISQTDLPLRVGLLIDASSSIRDRFRFEQEAAIEFLNQIIRPRSDEAFVLGFDSVSEITQDFTDDTARLAHGVRMLRPGGGTALFDAIYEASKTKLATARATVPTRRAIILLSDGEDNQSRVTREQAIEMAQRAEVIVYAISTNISGIKTRGDKVLERFAETTGGRVFFPTRLDDVTQAFTQIQDELRSQYALAYKPADFLADGRFHTIASSPAEKDCASAPAADTTLRSSKPAAESGPHIGGYKFQDDVMATEAPSVSGRSSRAAYPALHLMSEKLFGRGAGVPIKRRCCVGWGGVEPPFVFGSRNKRWLDFTRHDNLICRIAYWGIALKRYSLGA